LSQEGFVYVARAGDYYKIGYSKHPETRVLQMMTGNPVIELVGVIDGSMEIEAEWHYVFRDKCVRGEWFRLTEEDVARVLHEEYSAEDLYPDHVC
jgi:hypothetical protein